MSMPQPEAATRRAVLERLKLSGPQTAQSVADALEVTAMAVRQHLYGLEAEGLVRWSAPVTSRGRPAKYWALTGAADRLFPDAHQDFAVELIASLRETLGEDGFARVLEHRGAAQAARYGAAMPAGLGEKVAALAAIRTQEGYMAHAEADGDGGYVLAENHCPVCAAARACSGICANELAVFRAVLGNGVTVERTDHILAGARRCAYRVRPAVSA